MGSTTIRFAGTIVEKLKLSHIFDPNCRRLSSERSKFFVCDVITFIQDETPRILSLAMDALPGNYSPSCDASVEHAKGTELAECVAKCEHTEAKASAGVDARIWYVTQVGFASHMAHLV